MQACLPEINNPVPRVLIEHYFKFNLMSTDNYIKDMYRVVDAMEGAKLAEMMTENGIFRFANIPAVKGREAIAAFLDSFYQSIQKIEHSQLEDWQVDDVRFATGIVSYTRHDNSSLSVPFSVILKMQGDLIHEYLIFVDTSELYQ